MPYGVPAAAGGDSALNNLRMEKCVADVKAKNPNVNAYAVCKSSMGFTNAAAKGKRGARRHP